VTTSDALRPGVGAIDASAAASVYSLRWRRVARTQDRWAALGALVEPKVFHPGVFARFIECHRAVAAAYRAAEGLRSVVDVAQLAEMQPGIASTDITPDPQGAKDLAQHAEAVGNATEGTDHVARLEPRSGQRRINFLPAVLAHADGALGRGNPIDTACLYR
jgi:hypothetical protein